MIVFDNRLCFQGLDLAPFLAPKLCSRSRQTSVEIPVSWLKVPVDSRWHVGSCRILEGVSPLQGWGKNPLRIRGISAPAEDVSALPGFSPIRLQTYRASDLPGFRPTGLQTYRASNLPGFRLRNSSAVCECCGSPGGIFCENTGAVPCSSRSRA